MLSASRIRTPLVVALALAVSMVAFQAPAEAATTGKVRGGIYGVHGTTPKVVMQWFTKDWTYLGKRKQARGSYSLSLRPGTYWLQFVDQRPAYDVTKAAPTNIKVTIRAGHTVTKNVKMRPGAAITGTAKAGGKPARGARIVAANPSEQSFEVRANSKGQFALAGLPAGNYSVFTYDRSKKFVGKSLWVPHLRAGKSSNVAVRLTKPAGRLLVDLYAGPEPVTKNVNVTVVSKASGQFWSANARHGSVSFQGLYPGRYKIVVPGVGDYFGSTGAVHGGKVRPGKVAFGSYRLTQRGGWVTGNAVDGANPAYPIKNAQVLLFDKAGTKLDETTSSASGSFTLDGQLRTQSGMTVVVNPGPSSGGWTQGAAWCHFESKSVPSVGVTQNKQTALGTVRVPRTPVAPDAGVQCAS
jgi:hypothetical protein